YRNSIASSDAASSNRTAPTMMTARNSSAFHRGSERAPRGAADPPTGDMQSLSFIREGTQPVIRVGPRNQPGPRGNLVFDVALHKPSGILRECSLRDRRLHVRFRQLSGT